MAKIYDSITAELHDFITRQYIFFVATAPLAAGGHVNLSPKGLDCFRILSPTRVAYLDLVGSGNETSAHLLENGRITFMFCAFEGSPLILRLFGHGETILPGDAQWIELSAQFPPLPAPRQVILAEIALIRTSCGFGVPLMEYQRERDQVEKWAEKKGPHGLARFQMDNNLTSLDGLATDWGLRAEKPPQ